MAKGLKKILEKIGMFYLSCAQIPNVYIVFFNGQWPYMYAYGTLE